MQGIWTTAKGLGAGLVLGLLAACSGSEPSKDDILQALLGSEQFVSLNQRMLDLDDDAFGRPRRDVAAVTVVDRGRCAPATNADGYVCDVRVGASNGCGDDASKDIPDAPTDTVPPAGVSDGGSLHPAACTVEIYYGQWTKLLFFQANGQWQFAAPAP